jgi:hypothetical protein
MTGIGLALISFLFFQLFYPYHLFFKEQIELFLWTKGYFLSYFHKPAWLACYAGDFLTQFFYLRGGGPVVVSLLIAAEWLLSSLVIRKICNSRLSFLWGLLPAGCDWILYCDLMHPVSVSIGFILVLILFLAYSSILYRTLSIFAGSLFMVSGYCLVGNSILILPLLIIFLEWKRKRIYWPWWLVWVFIVLSAPFLLRIHYLLTPLESWIFPGIKIHALLLPVFMMVSLMVALLTNNIKSVHQRFLSIISLLVFTVLLTSGIIARANFNLEKILSLDSETYFGNPDRVLQMSQKYGLKERFGAYYTNMALATKGELSDKLLQTYQPAVYGLIIPVSSDENWMTILFSNEVFFLLGDMNLAQHSAMLGMTFSPYQRSSRLIKRLAEINIINGDSAAARKYLRLLDRTLYHHKWSKSREKLNSSLATSLWLSEKRAQIAHTDTLRKSTDYLASLKFLVKQNPGNIIALDYLMCFHLLNKNLKDFREVYDQYGRFIVRKVPSVYQEALMILLHTSRSTPEEIARYNLSFQKMQDFRNYTQLFEQTEGKMDALTERFGKTYWFYFHFATIQQK